MLNEINKTIPKMEKEDSDRIYNAIINKNTTREKNNHHFKLIITFVTLILLICIIIPIELSNHHPNVENSDIMGQISSNENSLNSDLNTHHVNTLLNETSIIGMAAFNEFNKPETYKVKRANSDTSFIIEHEDTSPSERANESIVSSFDASISENTDEVLSESVDEYPFHNSDDPLKISYPYDYVKITRAYKFTIDVFDIEDTFAKTTIEANCGLGKLEVVVADFETYIDQNGTYSLSVKDTLISLRGYNGYYTILANSGMRTNDDKNWLYVFSSHKKLNEEEISKDFTPPILSIYLKEQDNERFVYFESSDNLLSLGHYNGEFAFQNINELEFVSRNTLYSVLELSKLPAKEVEVQVIDINLEKSLLTVSSDSNLKEIYLHPYTEGLTIDDIHIWDYLLVEFDFLFETYDPTFVVANSINIKPIIEE